jgi:hypothetical protein
MTDFGIDFRRSDDSSLLRDRAAAARARARVAAEQYVQLRRRAEAALDEARDLCAQTAELQASLRDSVAAYVSMLRRTDVPPERAIVMVKSAVVESDSYPDKHHRFVVEEAVRWAVDAYYAA